VGASKSQQACGPPRSITGIAFNFYQQWNDIQLQQERVLNVLPQTGVAYRPTFAGGAQWFQQLRDVWIPTGPWQQTDLERETRIASTMAASSLLSSLRESFAFENWLRILQLSRSLLFKQQVPLWRYHQPHITMATLSPEIYWNENKHLQRCKPTAAHEWARSAQTVVREALIRAIGFAG
jgi:hypothetical protein